MKTIFILLDTVNRRMLDLFGTEDLAKTPNINRLAKRGLVFDNHWCGSAPCMPARRDIMTGRLNMLEKPWGGIEPFDQTLQSILSENCNTHTHMFSDHSHYLIPGGENYTKGFTAWEVFRGQEGDPVWTQPGKNGQREDIKPEGFKGVWSEAERENRSRFLTEYDYPSVKTLWNAASWLENNHDAENFFLWVEAFDPHEPFDCPKYYLDLYEKEGEYDGYDFTHPSYAPNEFTEDETIHLRNRYKAVLTMADRHLGEILDVLDKYNMYEDTLLIFTTDHGFHLGEHGYMAKNYMSPYNEVFHIPMIIAGPGMKKGRTKALTQNIDLLPTVLDYYDISTKKLQCKIHGKNLMPVLMGEKEQVRDSIIYGYFGKQVAYNNGKYTYFRAATNADNKPCNVYCSVPSVLRQYYGSDDGVDVKDYNKIEMGRFLSWTEYPVYKFPSEIINFDNESQDFSKRSDFNKENLLFDIENDYNQCEPITDQTLEEMLIKQLKQCMIDHDSPKEQFERLGI